MSFTRTLKVAALMLAGAIVAGSTAQAAGPSPMQTVRYPWTGTDDEIAVNLAIGSLRDSMMKWLTSERGVHAETLLVSIGAVAGFSAQMAVQERIKNRDIPGATKDMTAPELGKFMGERSIAVQVTGKNGEIYYYGDLLNGYLLKQAYTVDPPLYNILGGGAVEAGVKQSDLPDIIPMFKHAAQTMGTSEFGILNVPKNLDPAYTPRQALDKFWPRAKAILQNTDGPGPAKGRSVKPEYWPLVTALVARQFLVMSKDTVDPRVAFALMMESAITMSKLDPAKVPQDLPAGTK